MSLYEVLADLELVIDRYRLERRSLSVSSDFERVATTVVLEGDGVRGEGEDVCYDASDHDLYPDDLELAGRWTPDDFSQHLEQLQLFRGEPARESSRDYRRWAFGSAALDLALRQAGRTLGDVLGLPYRPLRFVVSTHRDPRPWLEVDSGLEFKLDPASNWTPTYMETLAATGRVRILDYKGYYTGTAVDLEADPELYREVAEAFPDAILEDPAWNDEIAAALAGHEDRLSWDAPIHSVADLDRLPVEPRHLNVKPSRFGTVRRLMECLDVCRERGIACYGGGQFELGAGRVQIQALASLFYADAPNDVAPGGYNVGEPRPGLPRSPLDPHPPGEGFGPVFDSRAGAEADRRDPLRAG